MTTKTLTPVAASLTGAALTLSALLATDTTVQFENNGSTICIIENSSGSTVTATMSVGTVDGLTITPPAVSIAAGATKYFGPFPQKYFNTTGNVVLTITNPDTTVKAIAIKIGA